MAHDISFEDAADILRAGGVVAVPTEYSYALCADACNEEAVQSVLKLKKRDEPSPVVIGHPAQLNGLVLEIPPVVFDLQIAFWPGPLTLVMEAVYGLPAGVTGHDRSVAVRVPGWKPLAQLSEQLQLPLTATSANPAGQKPAFLPDELDAYFGSLPYVGCNHSPNPLPSTIADVRGGFPSLLRQGMIGL